MTSKPLYYPPGTNWNYAHTNYVILGLALEKITGKTMPDAHAGEGARPARADEHDREQRNAGDPRAGAARLHLRAPRFLGIPAGTPFYEESTSGTRRGRSPTAPSRRPNIFDLDKTAIAIGTGKLLSPESYKKMVSTDLRGKTTAASPTARRPASPRMSNYSYGLGIVDDRQLVHAGSAVLG